MIQCPSCTSYNEPQATFCNQCGRPLLDVRKQRRKRRSRRRPVLLALAGLLLVGMVLLLIQALNKPGDPGNRNRRSVRRTPSPEKYHRPRRRAQPIQEEGLDVLTTEQIQNLVESAIVQLELFDQEGNRLREIRGILVEPEGTVLSRFQPLLGAFDGICRFGRESDQSREINGLITYDPYRDLALLELRPGDGPESTPFLLVANPDGLEPGMEVMVLSVEWAVPSEISDFPFFTADGVSHARLQEDPALVRGAVVAVDLNGAVIGLCAPEPGSERDSGPGVGVTLPPGSVSSPRILVDPLTDVIRALGRPTSLSLAGATRQFYEGTFAYFRENAQKAMKLRNYLGAIDFLTQALNRAGRDGVGEDEINRTLALLRRALDLGLARRRQEKDWRGAVNLLEIAVQHFPQFRKFWVELGGMRLSLREYQQAVEALLAARQLSPGTDIDTPLQEAYLGGSARELDLGRLSLAAEWLENGIQALPGSARLHMELAKVYQRWGFYDDSMRIYQMARSMDPGLAPEIDAYLEDIASILEQREVLVLKFPEGSSSIRANVVVNGQSIYPFVIDTGATYTAISREIASALGYDIGGATPQITVATANGMIPAHVVVLDSLNLHGYAVRDVKAVVLPQKAQPGVGLLGLNFLNQFRYSVDSKKREFRLEKR